MRHPTFFVILCLLSITAMTSTAGAEWDDRFRLLGPQAEFNDRVHDFWVEGTDLYVVGLFTMIDGMPASNIAKWDGTSWSTLGNPLFASANGVYAITRYQGNLVVAGEFTSVDGEPGDVAVWDGSTWSSLGNEPLYDSGNDDILALEAIGSDLYIGGRFAERIVRWDGATTTPIVTSSTAPCCVDPQVWDLTTWNGDLIAAGIFRTFDGMTLYNIGRWDGSQWNALGGINIATTEVFVYNDNLYAQTRRGVYQWTGTDWVSATPEEAGCTFSNHSIYDALFYNAHLYISGADQTFTSNTPLFGVAKWTGSVWDDMRGGLGDNASCGPDNGPLAEYGGRLIVGGVFASAGGVATSNLATWTGDSWYANAPSDRVRAIATSGNDVYVGGDFVTAGRTAANHVARWNGNEWTALGSGVNGVVHAMVVIGSDLYVGGDFTDAGDSGARYLARWNGTTWSPISAEFGGGPVFALATDGSNLYVGGDFLVVIPSQSLVLQSVAKWDGALWSGLGGGIQSGSVRALAIDGPNLYVGGTFSQVGAVVTGNMVKWDGTAWNSLALGFDAAVRSLGFHGGELHAGGDFTMALGSATTVNHLARWDGAAWQTVGATPPVGTNQSVQAMVSTTAGLVVVGDFTTVGATPANRIARWTGAEWETFGEGLNKPAEAVAAGSDVWVGGQFETAGTQGSPFVAHWIEVATALGDIPLRQDVTPLEPPYPNPFNPETNIRFSMTDAARVDLAIFDVNGRRIRTLSDRMIMGPGPQRVTWDGRTDGGRPAASGIYYVRLRLDERSFSRKMVLLR